MEVDIKSGEGGRCLVQMEYILETCFFTYDYDYGSSCGGIKVHDMDKYQ